MQVFGEWAQVEVVELWNDGSGLAFGIVGGRSSGVVVKSVLAGGVADRDGRLRSGDMLLRIGSVVVVGMCARQAAAVLRQCGAAVRLLVARPVLQPDPQLQGVESCLAPVVPSRLLADPAALERRLADAGHRGFGALAEEPPPSPPPTIIEERLHHRLGMRRPKSCHIAPATRDQDVTSHAPVISPAPTAFHRNTAVRTKPVASIVAVVPRGALTNNRPPPTFTPAPQVIHPQPPRLPLDMAVRGSSEPETLSYEVQLGKNSLGLGITVAGYVCEQEELSGIFVKSISAGSSADLSGQMQVNDRIVAVDGVSLHGVTNHRAVALLRDAKGPLVRLKALRYLRGAGFEKLQRALAAQEGRGSPLAPAPPSPSVTSLAKYSFSVYDESTVIETEVESCAPLPSPTAERGDGPDGEEGEIVIGRDDAEETRRIQDKWRDLLSKEKDWPGHQHEYDIVVGTIVRDKEAGLGISLEGTVRVVSGREVQARHYIRALAPRGPVASTGLFSRGDELLEVNGWRVLGAHHVEVVSRLRTASSPTTLVAVRTRRDRDPPPINSSVLGGSLQQLAPPVQRLIKAKSESSVASLCSTHTVLSHQHSEFCSEDLERNRSRSLEPLSGLAMWSDEVEFIDLMKEDRGLGFSILDYLDPSEPSRSVIVVRAVVAGGAAARHGRLAPGDRLVSVNGADCARSPLAAAVRAIKAAPRGIVRIGISKPLPCSTVVGGDKANGHSVQSSQECVNSLASDDHTGMDSFHECLQEYGEGIEVVQICLEPEEPSIKDDELSALGDFSFEDCKKDNNTNIVRMNGIDHKSSKSDSLDEHDDDMTITEDDVRTTPRELPDLRIKTEKGDLIKQQSKEISTSDEMVFAVTPTGLERISFDKYWNDDTKKTSLQKVKSDESWKECLNSPNDNSKSFYEASQISVQDSNLLYIDHEIDGYETCLEDESIKNSRKIEIKVKPEDSNKQVPKDKYVPDDRDKQLPKHCQIPDKIDKQAVKDFEHNEDDDTDEVSSYPYVQEHIIKQMQSLRIEPINVNIAKKKKSPTKEPSKNLQCVEYYNDQAECLKEIRQQKLVEEEKKHQQEQKKVLDINQATMEKKLQLKIQEPSEESTDQEYVHGCHKCFLENYAYAITTAYLSEATSCKYCEVIRDMLEVSKVSSRRMSAPALVNLTSSSDTEEEEYLMVPVVKGRRKSAGPLKYLVPSRRPSYAPSPKMTVTVNLERRGELTTQRWGPPRRVTLKRSAGAALGVSIVGGKVDIISNRDGEEGEEKAIFGIFIKNVVPDSPAGRCGELNTGDRILEVGGECVRTAPHERCVQLIKAAGDTVTLTVQSLLAWNTESSDIESSSPPRSPAISKKSPNKSVCKSPAKTPAKTPSKLSVPIEDGENTPQHEITITVTSEPDPVEPDEEPKPAEPRTVYSDDEASSDDEDEEDEREMQGRTYTEKGQEIDRASAGAIKRSKEEREADPEEEDDFGYTTNKIRKKYASLGDGVVVVRLERSPKAGLGLSLAGHRDRSRMAVFICGLNPAGSAAKASPPIKVGDEILEVNGIVLHGRCHLNASAIIKGLVGPVFKIILLRRKSALEDVAVKPLTATQFPVALEEESEDRFAGYKGVRDITVKKGPSGLGIMIIEGRHTEAGRGIFVSDLQEGSAAEQAGLQIGDMLLAVNRDSLLSCTYDAAAAKLKQAEGVVALTVCSPNMKDPADGTPPAHGGPQTSDPGAAGASRPVTPRPAPSPVKAEPPPDPSVAPILPNENMTIEVASAGTPLGVKLLGGSDTLINGAAAIILDIYKDGCIAKDGRLKVGDQILDCNGIPITKEMAHERLCLTIKQKTPKLRMLVHRPEPAKYDQVEVELARKPGKPLGITCVAPAAAPSLYLGDMLTGSPAELDGRLQKGDFLVSVDGKDMSSADLLTAATALKLCGNKVNIKVKRFKTVR